MDIYYGPSECGKTTMLIKKAIDDGWGDIIFACSSSVAAVRMKNAFLSELEARYCLQCAPYTPGQNSIGMHVEINNNPDEYYNAYFVSLKEIAYGYIAGTVSPNPRVYIDDLDDALTILLGSSNISATILEESLSLKKMEDSNNGDG